MFLRKEDCEVLARYIKLLFINQDVAKKDEVPLKELMDRMNIFACKYEHSEGRK